ncbi:response regulator transcription factor [Staphylococcus saccharolyticus]|uniref:response regulator transcription factor n=1 Tax=Staphylococcus saccharolyticus TaxID=33028 RepID=UPI00102DEE80|nr:response regulator transcription factor [Staphylococcus saccharolyticus]MBL7573917.1 response regulator transcription factor [Staphylococcus saccharolyticus]MBL7584920.1 response regulator transcription factor [Staphylococcus saccharolyticus]MBL7639159.1 response regulator transcription factor [Staphylococcus saccharolyticus]QRJ68487.1 response regulator transcription factor [Staphylococcus saccharolyticus]TAA91802.1 DNA-binding response regulator [Staphylococcus saccharolyticus]
MRSTLLVVEDDEVILHLISVDLTMNTYKVITAKTGKEADFRIRTERPDIILLDLGLPDIDGLSLIQQIREVVDTPIIVISARTAEQTIVQALDYGANDYMTKPFNVDELRARIRVAMRISRASKSCQKNFVNGPLAINFDAKTVYFNNEPIHLTPNEFKLLDILCCHVGKVLTYKVLLKALYGYVNKSEMASLRVHMASLRKKLNYKQEEKKLIITHPRIGYQMQQLE